MPTQIASRKGSDLDHNSLPGQQQFRVRRHTPKPLAALLRRTQTFCLRLRCEGFLQTAL